MKYDFNQVCDRRKKDCIKWDFVEYLFGHDDVLPMWVADMDFPVAAPIVEALKKRVEHEFYGYTAAGTGVIQSVIDRMWNKYAWKIKPEWIVFTPGIVSALNIAVRALTHPGDEIVLQEPVYYPFFPAITSGGCQIANNQLKLINGRYEMDFKDLDHLFQDRDSIIPVHHRIKAIMLCNPHNPVGRVWGSEELTRLGEIALKHGIVVISDEIHCELLFKGHRHTPFASISGAFEQNSITCMSPSKTFNLAGLEVSAIIIPDEKLRRLFSDTRSGIVPEPNLFGFAAMEAAYKYGDEWLGQLQDYLQGNLEFLLKYFTERITKIKVVKPQGTYLVWLDCRDLGMDDMTLRSFMRDKVKVGLDDGFLFGTGGSGFQRINIACPRALLEEALRRLENIVNRQFSE
jgi:cystathionine beta-lyase